MDSLSVPPSPKPFRWLRLLVIALVGAGLFWAVALVKVAAVLADIAMTIPPIAHPGWNPAIAGLGFEKKEAVAIDGVHLKGWWIPAGERFKGAPLPPVLVIHGLGADKEFMVNYILLAHQQGHAVLAIDLRGHGESDPGPTTLGYREPRDVMAWLGVLHGMGESRVILWGTSLGAVTSLRGAAEAEKEGGPVTIAGVIADAPFDTLPHTLENHARLFYHIPYFPLIPLAEWQIYLKYGFATGEVDSTAAARSLHAPLLVLAAERDNRMPFLQTKAIYEAASGPKEFYLIPGETHERRLFAPEFREKVTAFLKRCSTPEPTAAH